MTTLQQRIEPISTLLKQNDAAFRDGCVKSVQHGDARMNLLILGLDALAAHYNFPAAVTYISTGELTFNGNKGRRKDSPCSPFGEPLAQILSSIETRTGMYPSKGHVLPQNGWLSINHFEVERLLHRLASDATPT